MMSPANVLRVARAFGVKVRVDGEDLAWEAAAAPPAALLGEMARLKQKIRDLLLLGRHWVTRTTVTDLAAFEAALAYRERVEILRNGDGHTRVEAEKLAWKEVFHPVRWRGTL
jgi:hypothetical protein